VPPVPLGLPESWTTLAAMSLHAEDFDVTVAQVGTVARLVLAGEIDLGVVDRLSEALGQLALDEAETLQIDLTRVQFADSTAVAWLIDADHRAQEHGVRLELLVADGPVARLLEMTGVDHYLAVEVEAQAPDRESTSRS
jgi:anti-sigma B factor antagonist